MKLRFYYNSSEISAVNSLLDPSVSGTKQYNWIKYEGSVSQLTATLTPTGWPSNLSRIMSVATPDSSGTEDGIPFIEFWGITHYSTFAYTAYVNSGGTPLPLDFVSFDLGSAGCAVTAKWQVANIGVREAGTFFLQRSSDGSHYQTIAAIPVQTANTDSNYTFTDDSISSNGQYFYRVEYEEPGRIIYTQVHAISVACHGRNSSISLLAQPNPSPAGQPIQLLVRTSRSIRGTLRVIDLEGRAIYAVPVSHPYASDFRVQVQPPNSVSEGMYIITLDNDDGSRAVTSVVISNY